MNLKDLDWLYSESRREKAKQVKGMGFNPNKWSQLPDRYWEETGTDLEGNNLWSSRPRGKRDE